MPSRAGKVAGFVAKHALRAVWLATMILTPLFGFWLASSLAAYQNATQWLALLVGLLLFPLLPLGWEAFYAWRRRRREDAKPPILTRVDRLVLRTLLINGLFLGAMLYFARGTAFRAIAVRGDWMLDGHHGPIASTLRGWLLAFADRLDARRAPDDDRYGDSDKPPPDPWAPQPEAPKPDAPVPSKDPLAWPVTAEIDPIVRDMPAEHQASIDSVGKYLASRFADKKLLVKALHDYVVLRLEYDDDALKLIEAKDWANTPSQDAEAVFARRKGVCEGYARLMVALGKAANVEIAYVTGHARNSRWRPVFDASGQPDLEGERHAWNAVKLDDGWYLLDATWDDPSNGEPRTTYLFTPPKLLTYDHLPEDSAWQLRVDPVSLGEFVRQPLLKPTIGEFGLALVEPTRSQITVDGDAEIVLDNPRGAIVSAVARRDGEREGDETRCKVTTTDAKTRIVCDLADGEWDVKMFAAPAEAARAGRYTLDYIGSILVNSH
jgi:transglutaminase-like putative cysteine protease